MLAVLDSTSQVPGALPASAPVSLSSQTAREALSSASMEIMMSARAAASRGVRATYAPAFAKGAVFSGLRLYTASGNPAVRTRPAIPVPINPNPRIATRGLVIYSFTPVELLLLEPAWQRPLVADCAARGRSLRIGLALYLRRRGGRLRRS